MALSGILTLQNISSVSANYWKPQPNFSITWKCIVPVITLLFWFQMHSRLNGVVVERQMSFFNNPSGLGHTGSRLTDKIKKFKKKMHHEYEIGTHNYDVNKNKH